MAKHLKQSRDAQARADDLSKVRHTVEDILADIEKRGNGAVRELSIKFDQWDRTDFRLTDAEIKGCLVQLTARTLTTSSSPRNRCAISPRSSTTP